MDWILIVSFTLQFLFKKFFKLVYFKFEMESKVVWVNGAFHILHSGHMDFLKQARVQGNRLIVGLNSDASIKKYKSNNRPIENQEIRKKKLMDTGIVDEVIIFDEPTPVEIIKKIGPEIIVRGHDQKIEQELKILGFKFYRAKRVGDISTSKILGEK